MTSYCIEPNRADPNAGDECLEGSSSDGAGFRPGTSELDRAHGHSTGFFKGREVIIAEPGIIPISYRILKGAHYPTTLRFGDSSTSASNFVPLIFSECR